MSETDLAALRPGLTEVSLARGQTLHDADQDVPFLYFPSTAVTSVITVMADGRGVETSTIGFESAPSLLCVLANRQPVTRVFTQIAGSAMRVPAPLVRKRAAASTDFMNLLLTYAQANTSQAELSVACNALHSVPERLARWMLLTEDRVGNPAFALTQEFLAVMLGVQRTTVTSAAAAFKKSGMVKYVRGEIGVLDRPALKAVACECYAVSRNLTARLIADPRNQG